MAETNKPSVVTQYGIDLITRKQSALGLNAIHYGDVRIVAAVPACCVEPARSREEYGGLNMVENEFILSFIIYHTGTQGVEGVQKRCDEVTEAIRSLINQDALPPPTGTLWGGLLYEGRASETEYGYRVLTDATMRANRMVFRGRSKTLLLED